MTNHLRNCTKEEEKESLSLPLSGWTSLQRKEEEKGKRSNIKWTEGGSTYGK